MSADDKKAEKLPSMQSFYELDALVIVEICKSLKSVGHPVCYVIDISGLAHVCE